MMDRSTDKNTEKRKENKKTYRGRLVAAFVVVLVTTLLEIIYYGYHIMDNRDNVVHSFKNEQDSTAQIIADEMCIRDSLNIPVVVDEYFYELLYFCRNVSHEISFQT